MDLAALITPTTERLFGYGVLGVAVFWLSVWLWIERKDRRTAERAVDAVRKEAAAKLEEIQGYRVNELRGSLSAIRDGEEAMGDMRASFETRLDGLKNSIDNLAAKLGRQ